MVCFNGFLLPNVIGEFEFLVVEVDDVFSFSATSPLLSKNNPEDRKIAEGALSVKLTNVEIKYLEEPYRPKLVLHIR